MFYRLKIISIVALIWFSWLFLFFSPQTGNSQQIERDISSFKYQYLFSFETNKGKDKNAGGKPRTIAINSLGSCYIVIPYSKEVRVYGLHGNFLFAFGKALKEGNEEKGCFGEPSGIAIDNENNVYISDLGRDVILVFDPKGQFKYEFPLYQPAKIGLRTENCAPFMSYNKIKKLLYVPDPCNQFIALYTTTGQFVTFFGKKGIELGKFGGPANCAFNNKGDVFIVDPGNFRIQQFNSSHEPKNFFGSRWIQEESTGPKARELHGGEFVRPYGITLDSFERIYVSDVVQKTIQVFNKNGVFLAMIGSEREKVEIKQPLGITCTENNNLYIVDGEELKIHVFQID